MSAALRGLPFASRFNLFLENLMLSQTTFHLLLAGASTACLTLGLLVG